ncbi:hypothetical protein Tco_1094672 [Tanacetum coccineum]|uniref:Uncharacterized protein n=1 Tax=Tanacetum coccineum TaxID=301880 RepID=A0ABQ5IHK3_9ASTR
MSGMMLETFRELYELRLLEQLQMFDATIAMRKDIMLDEAGVNLTDEQNDFLFADASRMEEIEELNIIFDAPNDTVNSGSVEEDNIVQQSYELEQLARNTYMEAEKQQILAKNVQQHNIELTKQLESYKEKVLAFEITNQNNTKYFNEYIEADRKAKHFEQESQSQYVRDRDIIRDLEQQRDKLDLNVVELQRQIVELQKTQSILKRKMCENEDHYHDTVLNLEERVKKNVDMVLKIGNSVQRMFMLRPKPMSFYDSKLKHGLGYANPYTLKKAVYQYPNLYDVACLDNSQILMHVRDTEDILEDATKSQIKMKNKMQDPIAIQKKKNVCTIYYTRLNALYDDFVPQKELFDEQKYFPPSYISSENPLNESSLDFSSETKTTNKLMPSANRILVDLNQMETDFQKLFEMLETASKRESIFYTFLEEKRLIDFCQQQLKPILHKIQFKLETFQKRF